MFAKSVAKTSDVKYVLTTDTRKISHEITKVAENLFDVSFYDGDILLKIIQVKRNERILEFPKTTKIGYTFTGFSIDDILIDTNYIVTKDVIARAEYLRNEYTIKFYNKNEIIETRIRKYNDGIGELPIITKDGYITKWKLTKENNRKEYISCDYLITKDVNLISESIKECVIMFYLDGKEIETKKILYMERIDEFPISEKEGYVIDGWYTDQELTMKFTETSIIEKDLSLYATMKCERTYRIKDDSILFGEYPQTVVMDKTIINKLNSIKITNSNGYYEYNGNKYAKVIATPYEKDYCFSNQTNTIKEKAEYYFLVEPIKWKVLSDETKEYFLLSEYILDKQQFYSKDLFSVRKDKNIFDNNYEYSCIRAWLNNDFYNRAFNDKEKEQIKETLVDNKASTTNRSNKYVCSNTIDRVFLLSYQDIRNKSYGFEIFDNKTKTRETKLTDYARTIGSMMSTINEFYGSGPWFLRSPINNQAFEAYSIYSYGNIVTSLVDSNCVGVRMAIKLLK